MNPCSTGSDENRYYTVLLSLPEGGHTSARTPALGARLDARIDAQGADLGGRIMRASRIDALTSLFADHLGRHAS